MDRLGQRIQELELHLQWDKQGYIQHPTDERSNGWPFNLGDDKRTRLKKQLRYLKTQADKDVKCLIEWSRYQENQDAFLRKFESTFNNKSRQLMKAPTRVTPDACPRGV